MVGSAFCLTSQGLSVAGITGAHLLVQQGLHAFNGIEVMLTREFRDSYKSFSTVHKVVSSNQNKELATTTTNSNGHIKNTWWHMPVIPGRKVKESPQRNQEKTQVRLLGKFLCQEGVWCLIAEKAQAARQPCRLCWWHTWPPNNMS